MWDPANRGCGQVIRDRTGLLSQSLLCPEAERARQHSTSDSDPSPWSPSPSLRVSFPWAPRTCTVQPLLPRCLLHTPAPASSLLHTPYYSRPSHVPFPRVSGWSLFFPSGRLQAGKFRDGFPFLDPVLQTLSSWYSFKH